MKEIICSIFLLALLGCEDDSQAEPTEVMEAEVYFDSDSYTYSGEGLSTTGDFKDEIYINSYRESTSFILSIGSLNPYDAFKTNVSFTASKAITSGTSLDFNDINLSELTISGEGGGYYYRYSSSGGSTNTIKSIENMLVRIDSVKGQAPGQLSQSEIEGEILVDFTDSENNTHQLNQTFNVKNSNSVRVYDSGEIGKLQGCWISDENEKNAFCFKTSSWGGKIEQGTADRGIYVQDSVNGNPGTLYIYFDYEVNFTTKIIRSKNTYIDLVDSCCDYGEEPKDPKIVEETFSVVGDVLTIGNSTYTYTSVNKAPDFIQSYP